ncbi:hypothetical protein [Pseudorhodoferax sp. Leaf274]|uniref:hypothetical protein n=1 Tax=Pseudorhodoferax sp. Leaf274 TaxID=1736318 RepID=UPI0007026595|nr:hypothetical protein [Pseudorhodoferax sp. Leaf274]KQP37558.1 hypothetical protein ASF44_14525 [Pseudorhodoferax sp. Leaf274]
MPKFTTPAGTTQRYIAALDRSAPDAIPGTKKVYADRAAFLQGVADERACIAMGLPVWYDGIDLQVLAEPAAVKRLWTLSTSAGSASANAAASHGRAVVIAFKKFTLPNDDSRVHSTTGAPGSGIGDNGDLALDEAAGIVYRKATGAWAQENAFGGGGSTSIPFSPAINFRGDYDMGAYQIAGPLAFTFDLAGAIPGKGTRVTLLANGVNVPTAVGAAEVASYGFDNRQAGYRTYAYFEYDGTQATLTYTVPDAQAAAVIPVAPSWSSAPVVTSAMVGSAVMFTSGTASGSPTPTKTFRTTLDGSPIGTANTPYTPISADIGKSIRLIETATNTAGAVDSAASAAFVVVAAGGLQAQTTDYLNRVAANGGSVSNTERDAADAFFTAANADGYLPAWNPRLMVPMGDANAQKVPLLVGGGAALDVWSAGVTYEAAKGWVFNAVTQFVDMTFAPSITGTIGAYLRDTQPSDTTQRTIFGVRNSGSQPYRITGNGSSAGAAQSGSVYGVYGDNTVAPYAAVTGGLTAGLWHLCRTSASLLIMLKNAVEVAYITATVAAASPGRNTYIGASNADGAAAGGLVPGSSVGYAFQGGVINTANALKFKNSMQTFMTALGRNV